MEAELQAQIPGIDRVISEYSVVRGFGRRLHMMDIADDNRAT
jgi:hypothetical protein